MGIDNLLPLLQPITKQLHLSSFKGKILGIDISPWLYKACYMDIMQMDDTIISSQFQHSIKLIQLNGHESNTIEDENKSQNIKKVSCVSYLLEMISLFEQNGVKMFAVYDGRSLGMKQKTIKKRKQNKENNLEKGRKLLDKGNKSEVRKYLSRGIRISQSIIEQSMRLLKSKNIPFIVAPYESDSQLCKMYRMSIIDAVVSEDSDFIVYGCKVLYKLDQEGMCEYIDLNENHKLQFIADQSSEAVVKNKRKNMNKVDYQNLQAFLNLDPDSRILTCILAGCDYVPSIKGIGIKKAIKLVTNEPEPKKLVQKLKQDKLFTQHIPDNYEEDVEKAYTIFKHSLIYNIHTNNLEPLSILQNMTIQQHQAIGQPYPQYLSLLIYSGNRTSTTLQLRDLSPLHFQQSTPQIKMRSLRNIKSQIGHRFKESMQIQQDDELKSISGQNYMLEVFQNYEKELETGLQNYINICVEGLI